MNIPSQIVFGPHTYTIAHEPRPVASDDFVRRVLGATSVDTLSLVIDSSQAPTKQADTFLHELIHLILISREMQHLLGDHQEMIVDNLASGLLEIFTRNGLQFDHLTER